MDELDATNQSRILCRVWTSSVGYTKREPRQSTCKIAFATTNYETIQREMTGSKLLTAALYATSLTNFVLGSQQPWLDKSLPYEERLQSFIAQLNTTQKLAMTQGDTEVSNPSDSHNHGIKIKSMLTVQTPTA